jgi:hypothetical protein
LWASASPLKERASVTAQAPRDTTAHLVKTAGWNFIIFSSTRGPAETLSSAFALNPWMAQNRRRMLRRNGLNGAREGEGLQQAESVNPQLRMELLHEAP